MAGVVGFDGRWWFVRGPLISIFSRGEKRQDLPAPALSQSLPGGERLNVAALSRSPLLLHHARLTEVGYFGVVVAEDVGVDFFGVLA